MMAERYVLTQPVQATVKGRETQVLSALGIGWQDGAPHIPCPYPNHADDHPSWRWDVHKAKAFCTCIKCPHSVFDIVMHVEGVDFETAKVRVAEILGRDDLIVDQDRQTHRLMSAARLLQPPADQQDPGLARAYLAHRLGVRPDQVAMPSTPVVGWRALPYYGPPPTKGGKPKLVGHHPCIVFGTIAPDGRKQAHRIYVAGGGAGKADLGIGPDGHPRDPKKSAKLAAGQSAAGCVVLWGDSKARHLLLAEGIETAAALAHARRAEVESGEITIAAALSASGLRAFVQWPANRKVTIAADRDEGRPKDDRGFKARESAACAFALAHHEGLEIHTALPGNRARRSTGWTCCAPRGPRRCGRASRAQGLSYRRRRSTRPAATPRRLFLFRSRSSAISASWSSARKRIRAPRSSAKQSWRWRRRVMPRRPLPAGHARSEAGRGSHARPRS
jgi:hypothetical protein